MTAPLGQMKACLFNLIMYASNEQRFAHFSDLAKSILVRFPCRLIFIKESTVNKVTETQTEILIEVKKEQLHEVALLVLPSIVPDLPLYLLWGRDPTADLSLLPHLEPYASKLIFDSECTTNLQNFAKQMLTRLKSPSADVMDLNWAYMSGWRDIFTKVFDSPESIKTVTQSQLIRITYNKVETGTPHNFEAQGIYLQAWIATRLKWKFTTMVFGDSVRTLTYLTPSGEVKFELIAGNEAHLPAGAITAVDIFARGHTYQMVRRHALPKVFVHVTTDDRCELPFTLSIPDFTRRSVFMREVFYQSASEHYKDMLEMICPIFWTLR